MEKISFASFGQSHNVALASGYYEMQRLQETGLGGARFEGVFHSIYDGPFAPPVTEEQLNPALVAFLARMRPNVILLSLSGNEHNILSIAQQERRFDFLLDETSQLDPDPRLEILPLAAIRETLREWMDFNHVRATARAFRATTGAPIYMIEPPPPLPAEHVRAHPEIFEKALRKGKISSDNLRHKIWRAQSGLYQEICRESDIRFVPVPAQLVDENGTLVAAACGADATHANARFGRIMIFEVMRKIRNLPEASGAGAAPRR